MQTQDTEQQIAKILDDLAEAQAQHTALRMDMEDAIAAATPPEVAAAIETIRFEAEDEIAVVETHIAELTALAKKATKSYGKSVKGEHLHAVVSKITTWDSSKLAKYAVAHPEITRFAKTWNKPGLRGYAVAHPEIEKFATGDTSVSIRRKR